MLFFLLWLLFAAAVGAWARSWGYSFAIWAFASLVLSPLLTAIILLATGPDTGKKKAGPSLYDRDKPINL